jgi:PEP-CTERM motif
MRLHPFSALAMLGALTAGPARAGTISIAASSSAITFGQTDTLTVTIDTTDPGPIVGPTVSLNFAQSYLAPTGVPNSYVGNYRAAPGVPPGSIGQAEGGGSPAGSGFVVFPFDTSFLSYDGPLYEFDFTPTTNGSYTFEFAPTTATSGTDFASYNGTGTRDYLLATNSVTITVTGAPMVPEPGALTLAGIGLGALALRAWRQRGAVV